MFDGPVIIPGAGGIDDNAKVLAVLEPHKLFAITLKVPETKLLETSNVTDVVPCPVTIDVPIGAVQV